MWGYRRYQREVRQRGAAIRRRAVHYFHIAESPKGFGVSDCGMLRVMCVVQIQVARHGREWRFFQRRDCPLQETTSLGYMHDIMTQEDSFDFNPI